MKTFALVVSLVVAPFAHAGRNVCLNGQCNVVEQVIVDDHANVIDSFDVVQKTVQFDADYYLGLDGYYDVQNKLREQSESRDQEILLRQAEQIDRLIELLETVIKDNQDPVVINKLQEAVSKLNPAPEEKTGIQEVGLDQQVFDIFTNACAKCHSGAEPKGGLALVGEDDQGKFLADLSREERLMVYDSVANMGLEERGKKLMPLGSKPLKPEETKAIWLWALSKE